MVSRSTSASIPRSGKWSRRGRELSRRRDVEDSLEQRHVHHLLKRARLPPRVLLNEAALRGALRIPQLVDDAQIGPAQNIAVRVDRPGVVGEEVRVTELGTR